MQATTTIITIFETETIPVIVNDVYSGREVDGYLPIDELVEFVEALPSAVRVERQQGLLVRLHLTDPKSLLPILRHWRILLESAVQAAESSVDFSKKLKGGDDETVTVTLKE